MDFDELAKLYEEHLRGLRRSASYLKQCRSHIRALAKYCQREAGITDPRQLVGQHLVDYIVYRIKKSNVGPWGLSGMTEKRPMYLSPDLGVTVPGRGAQPDRHPPGHEPRPILAPQGDPLLRHPPAPAPPGRPPAADEFPVQRLPVLAGDEPRPPQDQPEQEPGRADVPVGHPHLPRADEPEDGREGGPLPGVPVLAPDLARRQPSVLVVHDQRLPRERPGRVPAEERRSVVCGGQVVSVEDADPVPGRRPRSRRTTGVSGVALLAMTAQVTPGSSRLSLSYTAWTDTPRRSGSA